MESPLTNLSNVLETIRDSADRYGEHLAREATTRAVLVDPVLRALGWDIADPDKVDIEAVGTLRNRKIVADYGLKSENTIVALVEAKGLGVNLAAEYEQVADYHRGFKVYKIFLTDGIVWQHFDDFRLNAVPAKTLNLRTDDLEEIAAYLVQELDAALISPQRTQIDLLSEEVSQLREEIEKLRSLEERLKALESKYDSTPKRTRQSSVVEETSAAFSNSASWTALSSISEAKGTQPSNLRLPDGSEIRVTAWSHVLTECCRYALDHTQNISMPLPDSAGANTNLIQSTPFLQSGRSKEIKENGKTFYVYVTYDANAAVRNALHVLKAANLKTGINEAAVVYE